MATMTRVDYFRDGYALLKSEKKFLKTKEHLIEVWTDQNLDNARDFIADVLAYGWKGKGIMKFTVKDVLNEFIDMYDEPDMAWYELMRHSK